MARMYHCKSIHILHNKVPPARLSVRDKLDDRVIYEEGFGV